MAYQSRRKKRHEPGAHAGKVSPGTQKPMPEKSPGQRILDLELNTEVPGPHRWEEVVDGINLLAFSKTEFSVEKLMAHLIPLKDTIFPGAMLVY